MSTRLGIIGGGQLGLYLCEAAQKLGLQVAIMSDSSQDAALSRADRAFVGALDNIAAVDNFLRGCDVVTFEKEAIPDKTLIHLAGAQRLGKVAINPGADILLMLKDKALQKTWLQQNGLPTLPFQATSAGACSLEFLAGRFGRRLVQKSRCGGYDGRGVQVLDSQDPAARLWDVPCIIEPYLPDCAEIAVITVRTRCGDIQTYPPVSMEFDPHLHSVRTVSMPASISPSLAAAAVGLAERVAILLNGVGVFAVEMFVGPAGELLINEISPRVHNSGHVTLDACNASQFEQHVRAVAGMPLVPIKHERPAAMMNILYAEELRDYCPRVPSVDCEVDPRARVYWYGKTPGRVGRKMGHVNAVASSATSAVAIVGRTLDKLSCGAGERAA